MIKLSLFMLDPVKAHAEYMKELVELVAERDKALMDLKLQKKENKTLRVKTKEKLRQMGCQIKALSEEGVIESS